MVLLAINTKMEFQSLNKEDIEAEFQKLEQINKLPGKDINPYFIQGLLGLMGGMGRN